MTKHRRNDEEQPGPCPRVLIRLGNEWSPVGHARIVHDRGSGMRLLRLDLSATAPTLYLSLQDIQVLFDPHFSPQEIAITDAIHDPPVGHA